MNGYVLDPLRNRQVIGLSPIAGSYLSRSHAKVATVGKPTFALDRGPLRSEPRRGATSLGAPLAVRTTRAVNSIIFQRVPTDTAAGLQPRAVADARVVTDPPSTAGSKARDATSLHDALSPKGLPSKKGPRVRATLDRAHLEPSVNVRQHTTHDVSLQTRPQACGRVPGKRLKKRRWRRVLFGRSNGAPERGWLARGLTLRRGGHAVFHGRVTRAFRAS